MRNDYIPNCGRMESKEKLIVGSRLFIYNTILRVKRTHFALCPCPCVVDSCVSACGLGFLACFPRWPHTPYSFLRERSAKVLLSVQGGLALGSQRVCLSLGAGEAGKTGLLNWEAAAVGAQKP